jgi:hypothetical protein
VSIIYTERAEKEFSPKFKEKIEKAFNEFPELLERKVIVSWENYNKGTADIYNNFIIKLKPNASYQTIGHELTHLLQGMKLIPTGEATYDIFTIARSNLFLDDNLAYLSTYGLWGGNRKKVRELCIEAIKLRNDGKRKYIYWLNKELKDIAVKLKLIIGA